MKKSASIFTPALTKALKTSPEVIQCQTDGEHIYITNGLFLVKLLPREYDEFVRPVTQRDPGSWTVDKKGQLIERKPMNMAGFLSDFDKRNDLSAMFQAPFTFPIEAKKPFSITGFYSATNDFVAFFDTKFTSMISLDRVNLNGTSPTTPMIVYHNTNPIALLLPFRVKNPATIAAVKAYFTEKHPKAKTKTAAPDPRLTAALEEVEKLREELKQAKAHATPKQPTNKAAAVLASLESLEGISAIVKGAQTSAPVVWIDGDTETHKAALEKLGAKWSGKRSAYYIQAA